MPLSRITSLITLIILTLLPSISSHAEDWPQFKYNHLHSASSPHALPAQLQHQWTLEFSKREQVWDDPLNHDLMPYDKIFEPIIADGKLILNFNDRDKIVAYDIKTGKPLWTFFTNGPVRFPASYWNKNVYLVSDDGYLYCLNIDDGSVKWKKRGGPFERKAIGNKRVISTWPARGAPVIRDGKVYFAASIWPFMGTFIYSLDAETGDLIWVNDGTGSHYTKQPHSAPAFAGVAPQGILTATKDMLLVPGGRSVPGGYDRETGDFKYFEHNNQKGNGGSLVIADDNGRYYVHTRMRGMRAYDIKSGKPTTTTFNRPVLSEGWIFHPTTKNKKPTIEAVNPDGKTAWSITADGSGDMIRAGNRLYVVGNGELTAIQLPESPAGKPRIAWKKSVAGQVLRLIAGADHLIAVTLDGRILAFGPDSPLNEVTPIRETPTDITPKEPASPQLKKLLDNTQTNVGYIVVHGADDLNLLNQLIAESKLMTIVVDLNPAKVKALRNYYDKAGVYGKRITIHQGDPGFFMLPQYFTPLTIVSPSVAERYATTRQLDRIYQSTRPYGGTIWFQVSDDEQQSVAGTVKRRALEQLKVDTTGSGVTVIREGRLPGTDDWTHQYGDIANTVKSDDSRVKLPLGILWFGGSSNMDVLPRHGHGPPEQVVSGQLYIEGMNSISARDVYTGRVLWIRQFEDLGTYGIYYNESYKDTPLSTAYNQKHIPGANARGTNFVATPEGVYLVIGSEVVVLDPKTGKTKKTIKMPDIFKTGHPPKWGFIGIYEDILIGGMGYANYYKQTGGKRPNILDHSASKGLIAFDRFSGKVLWRLDANRSFLHNGIVAGNDRLYALDRLPDSVEAKLQRRGMDTPDDYRIVSVDIKTGKPLWEVKEHIGGTWLGYSTQHDVLLQAGAKDRDRLSDESGQGMIAYVGETGKTRWQFLNRKYSGPCIIHNELIMTNANAYKDYGGVYNLLDGTEHLIENPVTGKLEPWRMSRAYGCNYIIASENLLTFRSGAAGYFDLTNFGGTGNFGGFKSSCTSNLVVANGVLNAPDYTRTCSCSYQNQTSLAMIHMPDLEVWTSTEYKLATANDPFVKRAGINFGAPGDRKDDEGTLWVDFPSFGGKSPALKVQVESGADGKGELDYFRRHSSAMKDGPLPWVQSSGLVDARKISIGLNLSKSGVSDEINRNKFDVIQLADKNDDAEEDLKNGKIDLTSSDLELISDGGDQIVGLRYRNVPFAKPNEVPEVFVQFTVDETNGRDTSITIRGERSLNAEPFIDKNKNLSSRTQTKATVKWTIPAWEQGNARGTDQRSPDISAVIREIVAQPGWKKGNTIVLLIEGSGKRVAQSRDKSSSNSALLLIKKPTQSLGNTQTNANDGKRYTVELMFTEPDKLKPGSRVFDIKLQGKTVAEGVDITREAGEQLKGLVKQFKNIPVEDKLEIELIPHGNSVNGPLISGVRVVQE